MKTLHVITVAAGQRVKVTSAGQELVIDEVVTCDKAGFIVAKQAVDCREGPPLTFDTRRDKVSVFDNSAKTNVGLVVVGIVAAVLLPVAIVGSVYLGGGL
jgi:hypothetical protein